MIKYWSKSMKKKIKIIYMCVLVAICLWGGGNSSMENHPFKIQVVSYSLYRQASVAHV